MNQPTIRPAVVEDAQYLSELAMRSKAFWGYSDEFMESCRDELKVCVDDIATGNPAYFVADIDDVIAGYFGIQKLADDRFELEALFVEPECIGRGVGRALMNRAIEEVMSLGGKFLLIQGDPNAESFYLAAGASQIGTRESGSIPGRHLPLFEIAITDA